MGYILPEWRWYTNDAVEPIAPLATQAVSAVRTNYAAFRYRANVLELPDINYLMGWYQMNEGVGATTLVNRAVPSAVATFPIGQTITALPNLPVTIGADQASWSTSGISVSGTTAASASTTLAFSGCGGFGIFLQTNPWPSSYVTQRFFNSFNFTDGSQMGGSWGYYSATQCNHITLGIATKVSSYSYSVNGSAGRLSGSTTTPRWVFQFQTNTFSAGPGRAGNVLNHIVYDTGIKVDQVTDGLTDPYGFSTLTANGMGIFDHHSIVGNAWQGRIGDMLFFHPDAELTIDDFAKWYDSLRSRYNMAPRSGW